MAQFLPPGARGYLLGEQSAAQQRSQKLGALQALTQIENQRIQNQRAAELHPLQLEVLRRQAQSQDVKFAPPGSVPYIGGVPQTQVPFKPEGPQSDIGKLKEDLRAGRISPQEFGAKYKILTSRQDPSKEQAIERLVQGGLTRDVAVNIVDGRYVVSRDPISGQAQIIDKATGSQVGGPPREPPAPPVFVPPGTAIPPGVQGSLGTGPSAFFGNIANTVVGALGGSAPQPAVEAAVQALTNLRVQTNAAMQESIPGRPSVYLMQQLDKLAVTPGSLLQGDDRALTRLGQTRDMLKTEVSRLERDILAKPNQFRPDEVSRTRANHSQLSGILREYDTIIKNFNKKPSSPSGWSIRPLP